VIRIRHAIETPAKIQVRRAADYHSGFAQRYNRMAQGGQMADIERIIVQEAHAKTKANQALLVCAYEDEAKCRTLDLDGSISFARLQSRAASLPKAQEIIFY
jgi:hypothetical protein